MDTAIVLECSRVDQGGILVPDVPSGWSVIVEDYGWFTFRIDTGGFVHCRLMAERAQPSTCGFVVVGISDDVVALKVHAAAGAWTIADFRADATEPALTFQGLWIDPDPTYKLESTMGGYDHSATLEATTTVP